MQSNGKLLSLSQLQKLELIIGGRVEMLANITVADIFRPCQRRWAGFYDLTLIIGGSLLIGLSAQLAVPLPFSPVPVTAQTFAVLMIGAMFGSRRGGLSVFLYVIEGAAGLPVFAMGQGGAAVLLGPRGGYLVGFIAAAYAVGLLAEREWDRRIGTTILAMLFGEALMYAVALSWLFCLRFIFRVPIGAGSVLAIGLYPFIVGDILKIVLAAILLPSGWRLLRYIGVAEKRK
jgi:biotin transport system substrate-specific component